MKIKATNREIRISGVVLICYYILQRVCNEIILESGLYHKKTKSIVNNLLSTIIPLINLTRSKEIIKEVEIANGEKFDMDNLDEDVKTQLLCFQDFGDIIMKGNPLQLHALNIALENINNNKLLYTENELQYKLDNYVRTER